MGCNWFLLFLFPFLYLDFILREMTEATQVGEIGRRFGNHDHDDEDEDVSFDIGFYSILK